MNMPLPWHARKKPTAMVGLVSALSLGAMVLNGAASGAQAAAYSKTWEFDTTSQVADWTAKPGNLAWIQKSVDGHEVSLSNPGTSTAMVRMASVNDVTSVRAGDTYRFQVMLKATKAGSSSTVSIVEQTADRDAEGWRCTTAQLRDTRWHQYSVDYTVKHTGDGLDLRVRLDDAASKQGIVVDWTKVSLVGSAPATPSAPAPSTPAPTTAAPTTAAPTTAAPTQAAPTTAAPTTAAPTTAAPTTAAPTTAAPTTAAPTSSTDDAYVPGWGEPTWRDEFNGNAVDPTKWNVRSTHDLGLLFDAAIPDPSQVTVSNGILHIRGDWLDAPQPRATSSAGISTLTHKTGYLDQRVLKKGDMSYSQQYGRWEIRCKTPTGPHTLGALAAFWLRNQQTGEIDIMEAWGYDEKGVRDQRIDTETTTVHTNTNGGPTNQRYIWHHADYGVTSKPWDGFHTYAFEYTPTYAAIVVDGRTIKRTTPAESPNLWNTKYFGSPLHVRLNLHVGPSAKYWGLPSFANKAATQPLDYQVDDVRIWKYQG